MFFLYFLLLSDNKNKTPELQKKLRQVSRLFPAIKSRRFQLKSMPRPRFSLSQVLIGMNRGECGGADEECGCVGGSFPPRLSNINVFAEVRDDYVPVRKSRTPSPALFHWNKRPIQAPGASDGPGQLGVEQPSAIHAQHLPAHLTLT